jgi:excisionase family DNA binding protein
MKPLLTHNSDDRLLTKEEAAVFLGVSVPTIERWVREQTIQRIKIGRSIRFSKDALMKGKVKGGAA